MSMTREQLAALCIAVSGLLWGIFWIPLRALSDSGIAGVWAVVLFYMVPAMLLLPLYLWRWRKIISGNRSLHLAGILAGISLVLYAGALIFTNVVHALLFYYLTPIWSTLLARIFLGEPMTLARWGTIAFGLLGLLVILRVDAGFSLTFTAGDWMGLAAGIIWAFAAVCLKSDEGTDTTDFALSYFFWGSLAALALTFMPLEGSQALPDWQAIAGILPWFLPVALLLVIPPSFGIMWGASILSPGLVGILFMTEISAGAITAAIWAGEPFGMRELIGIVLITVAGILEPIFLLRKEQENPA